MCSLRAYELPRANFSFLCAKGIIMGWKGVTFGTCTRDWKWEVKRIEKRNIKKVGLARKSVIRGWEKG